MAVYNLGFVLEQALPYQFHTSSLQTNVLQDSDVRAHWSLIPSRPHNDGSWTLATDLRIRAAAAQLARASRIDALFVHAHAPAIFAGVWPHRVPSIISLDATPLQHERLARPACEPRSDAGRLERLQWRLNRSCYRAAQHIVAWSRWAKQSIVEDYGLSPDNVTVIPPGVCVREWARPTAHTPLDGPLKILAVGVGPGHNGGLQLLQAFRALRGHALELHLVTDEKVTVEPGLFLYSRTHASGAALKALYHHCDIFVLPGAPDYLPTRLCEAAAAGLALVATPSAAIPELVRHGDTGLIVPAGDASALEEALRRLALQPELRLRLGERALAHVSREYNAQRNTGRLLELLKGEVDMARMGARIVA